MNNELRDFYMISQKCSNGIAQATHYYVAYDDSAADPYMIYNLVNKLSYMYYNWTGSIRVPSPCQYVKKLTQLVGEKLSDKQNVLVPNEQRHAQTLYYL